MLNFLAQSACADRVGWMLIHSLWQFTLVALLAALLQSVLKRRSAAARYAALLAAMLALVALPLATWFSPWSVDGSAPVAGSGRLAKPSHVPVAQRIAGPERGDGLATRMALPAELPLELAANPPAEPRHVSAAPSRIAVSLAVLQSRVQAWLPELVLVWLVGVLLAACRPLFSWYTVHRLRTLGVSPAGDSVQRLLTRTAKTLGLARAVEVLQSTLVKTPVVVGHFRPVVLLPLCVVTGLSERQLALILAHELAHIRRHDYLINLLQTFVETLFFYHPAVWWLSHQIRNERENCCDDVAMTTVDSRADYGRALLALEELRSTRTALSLAAQGGSLLARIRRIAGGEPAPAIAGGGSVLCVILVSIAVFVAATWAAAPEADKPKQPAASKTQAVANARKPLPPATAHAWQPGQTLDFRVINARTKQPLPGVKLDLQCHGPGINFQDIKVYTTNAEGRAEIRLPDRRPDAVRVYPSKPGFVPLRVYWGDDLPAPKLPKSVTVPMEPGTVWGGVVRNEKGQPIAGVKVNVRYWERTSQFNPHLRVNIDDDIPGVTTDKDGRWRMDILPAKFTDDGPRLFLAHPDYVSDHLQRGHTPTPVIERPSYESLRAQTAVMVMSKGATISGRVTDESGKPIPAAVVSNQYDCYDPDPLKITAITNQDGQFRLSGLSHRQNYRDYFFAVQAAGYAPVFVEVSDHDSTRPAEIQLARGQAVHGRVVDESGKPLEGVSIRLDYWMGRPRQFHLKTTTDANGRFRINDAPRERTEYDFAKQGYIVVRKPLPPQEEDYQITLRPPLRIVGSIVDAQTNKPLPKCKLTKGWDPDNRAPEWETQIGIPAKTITNGRYEVEITAEQWLTRIRVEADGYMPAVSRLFKPYDPDRGVVTYDFRMTKATGMSGSVLGLDGQPLAGTEVFLAKQQFFVENGQVGPTARRNNRMVKTDGQGRFEFPPEVEPFYLIVLHEQGHIVLDEKQFAKTPTMRIAPWPSAKRTILLQRKQINYSGGAPKNERQTLTVRIVDAEGKPVEGANVASSAQFRAGYNYLGDNEPAWDYFRNVISDRDGKARLADQPYIACVVARHVERKLVAIQTISPKQLSSSEIVTITLQPQCKVFGKLAAKQLEARKRTLAWSNVSVSLDNVFVHPLSCMSDRADFHFYLPPGTYRLEAYGTDSQNAHTQSAQRSITVSPGQAELEVEPIELPPSGVVLLEGALAPELRDVVAWKNGGPARLSDLKGNVVVLALSTPWVADRPKEWMPNLFTICDKYRDRGLAIIDIRINPTTGIDSQAKLDERIAAVKPPFWDDRNLPIPIALALWTKVNGSSLCAIFQDYGTGIDGRIGLPAGVLIDRQGRIAGEFDLRSDRDNAVLEKLLDEK